MFITLPGLNDKVYNDKKNRVIESGNNFTGIPLNSQN